MPRPKIAFRTDSQKLTAGIVPRVVGVLTSLRRKFPLSRQPPACDLVEVRLDISGRPSCWLERCEAIQAAGWPVLLTIRLAAEGGAWDQPDEQRLPLFEDGLRQLAAVDVEWRSQLARPVATMAKKLRKVCVISFHDFQKTPPAAELEAVITQAQKFASIVKIATRLNHESDEQVLRSMLARPWKRPLCVIGMGPAWARTRVSFPLLGSCLAYGYLDKSTAPGQWSAAELSHALARNARTGKLAPKK